MNVRTDFSVIAQWIQPRASVLDLGSGDGSLLRYLSRERSVHGYGVEIDIEGVRASIENGVNVIQSDLEAGLSAFEEGSFDYVILSQTLQAMRNCERILHEMLRVGREGIVTFPNFGYWQHRWQILRGRMPVSKTLPYQWYNTPNIHLCTMKDFEDLITHCNAQILDEFVLKNGKQIKLLPNLRGSLGVFRFRKNRHASNAAPIAPAL